MQPLSGRYDWLYDTADASTCKRTSAVFLIRMGRDCSVVVGTRQPTHYPVMLAAPTRPETAGTDHPAAVGEHGGLGQHGQQPRPNFRAVRRCAHRRGFPSDQKRLLVVSRLLG